MVITRHEVGYCNAGCEGKGAKSRKLWKQFNIVGKKRCAHLMEFGGKRKRWGGINAGGTCRGSTLEQERGEVIKN